LLKDPIGLGLYDLNEIPEAAMMSEHGINHLTDFALFLPFSCIERRQTAASQCKATTLEVVEEIKKTVKYGEFAKTCKRVQNGPSQGSGPGGRWFEVGTKRFSITTFWYSTRRALPGTPLQRWTYESSEADHDELCHFLATFEPRERKVFRRSPG
jgi:hypothetical protein